GAVQDGVVRGHCDRRDIAVESVVSDAIAVPVIDPDYVPSVGCPPTARVTPAEHRVDKSLSRALPVCMGLEFGLSLPERGGSKRVRRALIDEQVFRYGDHVHTRSASV